MSIFARKSPTQRQADARTTLDSLAAGRGFTGRISKAIMCPEFTESIQRASSSMHKAERAAALRAAGTPAHAATVVNVTDTGQTINDCPNVLLTIDFDGQFLAVTTLVSRIAIPRIGDRVAIVIDPNNGEPLYSGL